MAMSLVQHVRIWYFLISFWKRNIASENLLIRSLEFSTNTFPIAYYISFNEKWKWKCRILDIQIDLLTKRNFNRQIQPMKLWKICLTNWKIFDTNRLNESISVLIDTNRNCIFFFFCRFCLYIQVAKRRTFHPVRIRKLCESNCSKAKRAR